MKIVKPKVVLLLEHSREEILQKIEAAGRTCYKSEGRATPESAAKFVEGLVARGHLSVLEHVSLTVRLVCDRGISHELVRHRIASYSQESTRYCNYGKADEISVILPGDVPEDYTDPTFTWWRDSVQSSERSYLALLKLGKSPQVARSVLPTCLKTEVVMTANLREWRLIMEQRTVDAAHPDMCRLMRPLLRELRRSLPEVFLTGTYFGNCTPMQSEASLDVIFAQRLSDIMKRGELA